MYSNPWDFFWHSAASGLMSSSASKPSFLHSFLTYLRIYLFIYLLIPLLIYFMEHSPSWEANQFLASQEIPLISWNSKVHYCNHKCPTSALILSQLDPVHIPTSYFLNTRLNIILPSTPGSPKWSLNLRSHTKILYTTLLSPIRATCPVHLILIDFIIQKIMGDEYRSLSSSLCSFFHFIVISSLLGPNILLNARRFKSTQYQMSVCYWTTKWKRCGREPNEASSLHPSAGSEQKSQTTRWRKPVSVPRFEPRT